MISGKRPAGISSAHDIAGRLRPGGAGRSKTGRGILNALDSEASLEESLPLMGLVTDDELAMEDTDEDGARFPNEDDHHY